MSDAAVYPNPAVIPDAVLAAVEAGDVGALAAAMTEETWARAEAVTWARAQRTARGMGFSLPDLHELDSPGRGDGAPVSAPEPSPSLNEREAHAA